MYKILFAMGLAVFTNTIAHADNLLSKSSPKKILTQPIRIEDVVRLVQDEKIRSVPELLERLPKNYMQGYALAFTSGSIQAATPSDPRALLFGTHDDNAILTFNGGDPKMIGSNSIEMMEFDNVKTDWVLREINFSHENPISEINPAICQSCHGGINSALGSRPNWKQNPIWTGFYGEVNDRVSTETAVTVSTFGGDQPPRIVLEPRPPKDIEAADATKVGVLLNNADEDRYLTQFKTTARKHPRYKFLQNLENFGFQKNGKASDSSTPQNFLLTRFIFKKNARRIQKILQSHDQIDLFKYAVDAADQGCFNFNSSIKSNAEAWFPKGRLPQSLFAETQNKDQVDRSIIKYNFLEAFGFPLKKLFTVMPTENVINAGTDGGGFEIVALPSQSYTYEDHKILDPFMPENMQGQDPFSLKNAKIRCEALRTLSLKAWKDADTKKGSAVMPHAMLQPEAATVEKQH